MARSVAQRALLKPVVSAITEVTVHGRHNLDNFSGPYVVVSNHNSHLDTPLIIGALPRRLSRYLSAGAAADYFFRNRWRAWPTVLFFNAFPVERTGTRNRKGLAGKLLSDGVPLLLYPEGTRSRTGQMAPFKPGAAALCISRNVPCIPVALVGAHEAMPHGHGWVRRGRPPVHVVIGSPMWARPGEMSKSFSERISKVIADMHDQTATAVGLPRLIDYASRAAEKEAREAMLARAADDDPDLLEDRAQLAVAASASSPDSPDSPTSPDSPASADDPSGQLEDEGRNGHRAERDALPHRRRRAGLPARLARRMRKTTQEETS
ncbi:lysophospholipid acyltransferase family protein [Desertihabitans aurantiacus]|uniref:lysophospholipid acyltransferase family protein n=1 Tax=Desertihabitans aurantiacus TaxID=2282477 RepID=UPI001E3B3FFF|nr:lysophospholipid acyltransferase family protein [Desertihabitans aurantiacus]